LPASQHLPRKIDDPLGFEPEFALQLLERRGGAEGYASAAGVARGAYVMADVPGGSPEIKVGSGWRESAITAG
jgi:hypothetical protein